MHKSFEETKEEFRLHLEGATDHEWCVAIYLHQMGITYTQVNIMENDIIGAMSMCNKIQVHKILGDDANRWEDMKRKNDTLYSFTLGSLIKILEKHKIDDEDIKYLRWVKDKRDIFVHRFFHDGRWPDRIQHWHCVPLCRQLKYLQAIFYRASHRITNIFVKNGLLERMSIGEAGSLVFNIGEQPFSEETE